MSDLPNLNNQLYLPKLLLPHFTQNTRYIYGGASKLPDLVFSDDAS